MGKAVYPGHAHVVVNGTLVNIPVSANGSPGIVFLNGTLLNVHLREPFRDSQLNELLYVIIVIVFYATALMTLIITQIKRQRREGTEIDYYDEYLQRNSEVKQTCHTATNIVSKANHPPPALVTAAFAAAAAGTLLGRMPDIPDDEATETEGSNLLQPPASPNLSASPSSPQSPQPFNSCPAPPKEVGFLGLSRPGLNVGSFGAAGRNINKSPLLESIPDEGM